MNRDEHLDIERQRETSKRKSREATQARLHQARVIKLMGIPEFRSFVWDLMGELGLMNTSFNTDPLVMAHSAGMQDAARRIYSELEKHAPNSVLKMMTEAAEERLAKSEA